MQVLLYILLSVVWRGQMDYSFIQAENSCTTLSWVDTLLSYLKIKCFYQRGISTSGPVEHNVTVTNVFYNSNQMLRRYFPHHIRTISRKMCKFERKKKSPKNPSVYKQESEPKKMLYCCSLFPKTKINILKNNLPNCRRTHQKAEEKKRKQNYLKRWKL